MLGLFTNTVIMTVTRPNCCSMRRTAVSEIHVSCEETLSPIWPRHVIEIEGLGASDPALRFQIGNVEEFVEWIEETGGYELRSLEGPCDFATAAMFSALNALATAPTNAGTEELAQTCLAEVLKLGTAVKSEHQKSRRDDKYQCGFGSVKLAACVRHEADAYWSWAITPGR